MPEHLSTQETTQLLSAAHIKAEARRLGFSACGLSPAGAVAHSNARFFRQWSDRGQQADMHYMTRHTDKRLNPRLLVPGCRTIVCVALNYRPAQTIPQGQLQLAWYAYGKDYHNVMRNKLRTLYDTLCQTYARLSGRTFCDTAPLLERYWAEQCGLGWTGRHTQLVAPECGSAFFLGELLLSLPADSYDSPIPSQCGECRRCIDACPTKAISIQNGLDARRCLSYLTIENRGEIPATYASKLYPYCYGCDRCLKACPHLKASPATTEPDFAPKPELLAMTWRNWMELDEPHYQQLFSQSAVERAGFQGLKRNLEAIARNHGEPEDAPA